MAHPQLSGDDTAKRDCRMTLQEKQIEQKLIERLGHLKYTYRQDIRDRATLEENFRTKFESLNHVCLTDAEFARLLDETVSADVFIAAQTLRERNTFQREDGTPLQYTLINIKDWCKNDFEVVNQLRINTNNSYHRYDVIILMNGVPVVQIELKTLDINPRQGMQQIVRYKNDAGNGYGSTLLCFIQLFVVSNHTNTYYFANNHHQHFSFNADEHFLPVYQLADKDNKKVTHLDDFADIFFSKCTLSEMIGRYMVLVVSEQKLMVMRPYQIYAVKAIVESIQQNRGNGHIWHTTGSGKTLTSFKASTLLKDNPNIEKCLFVVDRKDLDKQTREEFNKFQEGCVEENTNTRALVQRLLSEDYADKIIVTTIQKLGLALGENRKKGRPDYKEGLKSLRNKRIVFIFDECHRSQFGENHRAIKDFFPHAQLFGFTGTPIFEENATYKKIDGTEGTFQTTKDVFQKELHNYTIANAIDDGNVLRFRIDYFSPGDTSGTKRTRANESTNRQAVVDAILNKHDSVTGERRFNAILASSSINNAIEYYKLFQETQKKKKSEDENFRPLNIACVFSPPAEGNTDIKQLQEDLPQEKSDNRQKPSKKKEALKTIIDEYNAKYNTNYSTGEFDPYYQDVQQRIKHQKYLRYSHKNKIDVTIVVDMLLTGFDSQYLNTLYVDKNLKYHGLVQAFSRTNRILNGTKPHGNILDFRGQQNAVDEAIKLFSGNNKDRAKEIWLVEPASKIIEKFNKAVVTLEKFMNTQGLPFTPEAVSNLKGDTARSKFINGFKEVQRLKTQLDQYTDLSNEQKENIEKYLPKDQLRSFKGRYMETAKYLKSQQGKKEGEGDQGVQQLDFEFVLFSSAVIDYDYIMALIARYSKGDEPTKEKMTRTQLIDLIRSSSNLMGEHEDIVAYVNTLKVGEGLSEQAVCEGYKIFKEQKCADDLTQLADKYGLKSERLRAFVDGIMERMIFDGEQLSDLMSPLDLGWKARTQKELALMEELIPILKKLAGGREISGLSVYE